MGLRREKQPLVEGGSLRMTRCVEFYQKWANDPNWCEKCKSSVSEINSYLSLLEELEGRGISKKFAMANFAERAARPIFRERDSQVRDNAIDILTKMLTQGKRLTSGVMNSLLRRLHREKNNGKFDQSAVPEDLRNKVLLCDVRNAQERVPRETVDVIHTDPPYGSEYVDLWRDLGIFAAHALKPHGILVAYCGHANLLECCNRLSENLSYLWICALLHSGSLADIYGFRFIAKWKPIVIFSKGKYEAQDEWFTDVIEGTGREKGSHDWQQAVGESEQLLRYFTKEGSFVVDPFCGSGTTLLACKHLKRNYLGLDIDQGAVESALLRLTNDCGEE
jgi:SAM-dependent methyltransferase